MVGERLSELECRSRRNDFHISGAAEGEELSSTMPVRCSNTNLLCHWI